MTEVIAGNTISTENHLISSVDLFEANPKQLDIKLRGKKDGSPPLLFSGKCTGEEEEKGPSMEVVAAAVGFRRRRQALEVAAAAVGSERNRWMLLARISPVLHLSIILALTQYD